jgi:two-component system, chemotaxis family, sensor kinase CheA
MASLDQLKRTFFDECSEALQQIEFDLSDLREGAASDDTINAVFRSVHSVKGGAGIFGFDDLVKFAHVLETVLDAMRSGKLASSQEIVDALLQANDVLSDLVGMSRSGETIPAEYGSECRAALERILQANLPDQGWGDDSAAPADFEGLDFVPVPIEELAAADQQPSEQEYRIAFRPRADLLKKANEPLFILRELRKLGTLELKAETELLPLCRIWSPTGLISAGPERCAARRRCRRSKKCSHSSSTTASWRSRLLRPPAPRGRPIPRRPPASRT